MTTPRGHLRALGFTKDMLDELEMRRQEHDRGTYWWRAYDFVWETLAVENLGMLSPRQLEWRDRLISDLSSSS